MNFEWDREEAKDDEDPALSAALPARRSRRRWVLLLFALLLGAAIWAGQRRARRYVAEVESVETEALLASERLAQQAAAAGDQELFKTILSGRDPAWVREQFQLLAGGVALQEAGRVWALQPQAGEPRALAVTFDPELAVAELSVAHPYTVTGVDGLPATITLVQPRLYRRGSERWLLAPPPADFWGERRTTGTRFLALTYWARDEEVARRLATDLDRLIAEICSRPASDCPDAFRLRLHLAPDAGLLLALEGDIVFWRTGGDLDLPAPSLFGHPQDEAAYQALYRGYAVPVAEATLTELAGYACCTHVLLYRALLDWELAALRLRPWPMTPAEQVSVVDYLERPGQLQQLWEGDDLETATLLERAMAGVAIAELAAAEPGRVTALARRLDQSDNMANWVRATDAYPSLTAFMHALRHSLIDQIHAAGTAPSLPEQDLLASCREGTFTRLYRYDLAAEQWQRLGEGHAGIGARGTLVQSTRLRGGTPFIPLWREDRWLELRPVGGGAFLLADGAEPTTTDPAGRYLPLHLRLADGRTVVTALADVEACTAAGCPWLAVPAFPRWSPTGDVLLWTERGRLWRQSRASLGEGNPREVGRGSFPFWLDEEYYGYVRDGQLTITASAGDVTHLTLPLAPLLQGAGNFETGDLAAVVAVPGKEQIALFVDAPDRGRSAVLLVDLARPGMVTALPLPVANGRRIFAPPLSAVSPDGRWLVVHTSTSALGERGEFLLVDLAGGKSVLQALAPGWVQPGYWPGQQFAWSADGRWLARVAAHQIDLLAPQAEGVYRRYLLPPAQFPGGADCEALGWTAVVNELR